MTDQDHDRRPGAQGTSAPPRPFASSRPAPYRPSDPDSLGHPDSEPPSANFAGEDFLFHLYRGSELLQDNCIEEAKEELERALGMQPRDAEGQALLGVVYFRLGMFSRAIEIYQDLVRAFPREIAPRVNAALCYLKTGQPIPAREFLEEVIRRVPDHKRAWGYLGLVYERLGDPAKALAAFERAGQSHLARRMEEQLGQSIPPPSEPPPERAELRRAVADAVQELDEDPSPFEAAPASVGKAASHSGRWRTIELGRAEAPPPSRRLSQRPPAAATPPPVAVPAPDVQAGTGRATEPGAISSAAGLAEGLLVALPPDGVAVLGDDLVVVRVGDALSVRIASLRALVPVGEPFRVSPAYRRWRGRTADEPLGGASALAVLEGMGHVMLGAGSNGRLVPVRLEDEFLYLRESLLVAFEASLRYENGRLVKNDGTPTAMVQLSGKGHVVFETKKAPHALEVHGPHGVTVDADCVLGWTGRLVPGSSRIEPATGLGGLVTFSGDGAVFLVPG
jgi:hypothetical protein